MGLRLRLDLFRVCLSLLLQRFLYDHVYEVVPLKCRLVENSPTIVIVHPADSDRGAAGG